jgi:uncharacterized protein YdaU (DUF1376 family)
MSAALSNVTMLTSVKLPEPLVPPECDLRGMPGMMVDTSRLPKSQLRIKSTADEFRAAILLWCAAWSELPASSLPDDDDELAKMAGETRTRWRRIRAGAMRGWIKCSDGRFYHPVLANKARDAWKARTKQRDRANSRWHPEQKAEKSGEQTGKNTEDFQKSSEDLGQDSSKINDLLDAAALRGNGKEKGKEKKEDSPPPPAKRGRRKREKLECPWFDMFFFDYPPGLDGRPRGSPALAEANWRKAVQDGANPERMYEAYVLDRDNLWPTHDPKWIPNPENWITKARWKLLPDNPKQGDLLGGKG